MIKDNPIIIILCFLFLLGCSSDEYKQAEQAYLQAKSTHNITQLVTSLTILARLDPEEYSSILFKAQEAKSKLIESQQYIEQNNYYLAYLSSHESLQKMYSMESKKILIKSGTVLLPLLKAKNILDKTYQDHPLVLASLTRYKESPILDWNLLELNALLNKFSVNIISLEKSTNTIKAIDTSSLPSLSSELLSIELQINRDLQRFKLAQNYLIDLALHRNSKLLIDMNDKLSAESFTISQMFNRDKANIAMVPFINRSKNKYAPSKNIIENMFYASSSKDKHRHIEWFKKWKVLEKDILEPLDGFYDYSLNVKLRNKKLMTYAIEEKAQLPKIPNNHLTIMTAFQENKVIRELIKNLKTDSRFFST